jgi:hypothetical protein
MFLNDICGLYRTGIPMTGIYQVPVFGGWTGQFGTHVGSQFPLGLGNTTNFALGQHGVGNTIPYAGFANQIPYGFNNQVPFGFAGQAISPYGYLNSQLLQSCCLPTTPFTPFNLGQWNTPVGYQTLGCR